MGQTTAYTLDGIGQVRQVIDASGHTTTYDYDRLGRVTRKVWHDQSEEQFRYSFKQPVDADPAHDQEPTAQTAPGAIYLRVAHTLQDGQTNYSYYDALSRLVRTVYVDGDVVAYAYSSVGQLVSVTDRRGLTCYRYDDHQRVTAVDQLGAAPGVSCDSSPSVRRVAYTYDENNNRTSVTTVVSATSKLVGYAYDANNRPCVVRVGSVPASCADTAGAYVYTYEDVTADPDHGQRTTLTYPDGIKETVTYDPLGRLKHVEQQDQRSTLASYTYAFYSGNNRQSVTEGDGATTAWEYDDADRLTREVRKTSVGTPVWDLQFSYDDSGNRQEMHERIGGSRTTYAYTPDGLNQLASVTSNGTTRSYTYDGRGNLRSDGVATYGYNARNQLISLTTLDTAQTYTYDALGNRIRQTVNGTTTNYLWDEMSTYGDVLAELDSSGSMEASYVLAGGTLLEQTRGMMVVHPLRDGQGNTRLAVDARAGTVTQQYVYDAFGVLRDGPSAPTTRYLYTGQQFDQDSQLYSLRERYYHPGDGRFLNRDTYPLDAQSPTQWHRYVYGANNPVNGFDPSGQLFIENVTIDKQNDEQRKAHARYHAGTGFATGPDRVALLTESVFSAVFDEIFVTGSMWAFTELEEAAGIVHFKIQEEVAMGLGTVYHLGGSTKGRPDTITKAVTVNAAPSKGRCQWSKVASNIKCPLVPNSTAGIQAAVVSALQGLIQPMYPGSTVVPLQKESDGASAYDAGQQWKPGHAEILIARWALKEYAGPPTPHRMLNIATSIKACTKAGYGSAMPDALPCAQVVPTLHGLHPMLFEMTVFMP